jgi:hypothetical protein
VTDVVVIRSEDYTVDSPRFKAYVRGFIAESEITALGRARTYLDGGEALVSEDRHATIIPIALSDDSETEALVEKVETVADEGPFAVSVTGTETPTTATPRRRTRERRRSTAGCSSLPAGAVVAGLIPL